MVWERPAEDVVQLLDRLGAAVIVSGLAVAASWSARTGWADYLARQETVGGLEDAIRITPDNADYYAQIADLFKAVDPARAKEALLRAVQLNPSDARSWIELGLQAEAQGDNATAEQFLLRAADEDKQYLPRWTLTNFYYRHGNETAFWSWVKVAAQMVHGDPQGLFQLCGNLVEDGRLVDRLEIRQPAVRAGYLVHLLEQNRTDLIGRVTDLMLQENRDEDVPVLLDACDRQLDAGRVEDAIELWNRLNAKARVPFAVGAGNSRQLLANPNFATAPLSRGFDWRLPAVDGVVVTREESGGVRLTLSGREPEQFEALSQLIPVREDKIYQFSFDYRTSGIKIGTGLNWRLSDAIRGKVLKDGPNLVSDDDVPSRFDFQTPAKSRLMRLSLAYSRAPGTTRPEGYIVLRNLALEQR
ncbi:MAG TPA: hypothetical protein VGH38_14590 [Bryobacteraceae bacterium]|jgi:tetratricopeptide (TPR) repeat protein